jgi:hypothetical protein
MYLADFTNPEKFKNRKRELPKKFLPMPDFKSMKRGNYSNSVVALLTVEVVVHMLLQQLCGGYGRNRGGQPIDMGQILRWFEKGLCIEALGEFPIGESENTDAMTLASHHHRCCFLLYLYWMASDEMWNSVKKEIVSCRVFDADKITELYCNLENCRPQSKDGFLKNPDMVLGHIISCDPYDPKLNGRLANMISAPARNLIGGKSGFLQPLAALVYARTEKVIKSGKMAGRDLQKSHYTIYNCRRYAGKLAKLPYKNHEEEAESLFKVSDETLQEIALAIEDYLVFHSELRNQIAQQAAAQVNVKVLRKIMKQTGFFTFYIYDRVVFGKLPPAKQCAERLAHFCGSTRLGATINSLWNNDGDTVDERAAFIYESLRKRISRKGE